MTTDARRDVIRAAGAVVWRPTPRGEPEVVLVHRPKYDDWSLPKGKLDPGEHVLVAARREVAEETGYEVVLGRPLPTQHYLVGDRPKEVRYWAARATRGGLDRYDDVDDIEWLPVAQAVERLTWGRDAGVLDAFTSGPTVTVPLVLLRHASAVKRGDWPGDDEQTRPLNEPGEREAQLLAPVLAAYAPERVLSSDTRRTIDTVRPFAQSCNLPVELEPVFSQEGFAAHPDAALDRVRTLLRSDAATVVCTHRPVLPWLLATLFERSAQAPPQETLAPGEFWVLHRAGGRVLQWERHSPYPETAREI